jgi:hypothetical protein
VHLAIRLSNQLANRKQIARLYVRQDPSIQSALELVLGVSAMARFYACVMRQRRRL